MRPSRHSANFFPAKEARVLPNGSASSSRALRGLLAKRHARHLAGRAQTLQGARKPMHTDPSTI